VNPKRFVSKLVRANDFVFYKLIHIILNFKMMLIYESLPELVNIIVPKILKIPINSFLNRYID